MNKSHQHTGLFFSIALLCGIALFAAACGNASTPLPQPSIVSPPVSTAADHVIRIVADDWCPYNCVPDSAYPGYAIEAAVEIFKKAGYQIKYEYVPWARAVDGVLDGTYEGAIGASKGDIPGAIFPEKELGYYGNYLFVRKGDTWRYTGVDSLKNIRLGVIGDYYYSDEINAYIEASKNNPQVDVIYGNNAAELNLKKLLDNKIDVYLEDSNIVFYTVEQAGLDMKNLEIAGEVGDPEAFYIAFSPANPESQKWAEILSNGIRELRESGRFAEILQRYGLKDWE
jgi:polar amino acid transport system substrate-binding protein